MAMIELKNQFLKVKISSFGAELTSIQSINDQYEYLWQADPSYWNRHAPILFPIVGKLKNDQFIYHDTRYQLSQHGFARDLNFQVIEVEAQKAVFELRYTLNSLSVFPFKFSLKVIYRLKDNEITVSYQVANLSNDEMMYFSIGAHPAFNVPNFESAKLCFSPQAEVTQIPVTDEVLLRLDETSKVILTELPLSRDLFKDGVLVYETSGRNSVILELTDINKKIEVSYDNMNYLGLWSPYPKEAPFVCIEPWCGVADDQFSNGKLNEKYGINRLKPTELFEKNYKLSFL
ncbi:MULTISPECIES: aldose 1-epimerase family protein [unclassified Enterococcus]|uniref:aldose 1-epimerase family protein n=1 Tax=unclassified Enterococcus TaxID=2608891 RepID=UPI0015575804|nr:MULTISPECIES: aldose 1-epimerase family protein [unclassified Enterococcus]MBS7576086.1 aldose 1-epimerase family protein [Enterococcus sp. MMGLQ5-2]MBS7583319.1 aldose 1-epimerase family protein [Enterococcus sp. MMGLQ5-1]NPD11179.1 aldose 1-epimerase family protein [Enterococcus sp. MMGLQ5-1]NPD35922.1 aldose 1-epimerase family protein [Enterococcus sp. MMGLQ5-2]